MKSAWRTIAVLFGFAVVAVAIVLAAIYPYRPESVAGWLVLLLLALPAALLFELGGERLFNAKAIARLGGVGRVVYGVLAIVGVLSIVALAFRLLMPFLARWQA